MKIWLISPYGPIPTESWRDYRYTIIGRTLAAAGHEVVWWTPNYSHHYKRFRSETWLDLEDVAGFTVRLVPTSSYRRHIGLGRLNYERRFVRRFLGRASHEPIPDLLIATEPPQTVGRAARFFSAKHGIPWIADVMDLWPELFELALPGPLRRLAPIVFAPLYRLRKRNWESASGCIALAQPYLDRYLETCGRPEVPTAVIYNGIDVAGFRAMDVSNLMLPPKPEGTTRFVYAGTLGENYDVRTLVAAAGTLLTSGDPVQFVVAGDGPLRHVVEGAKERHPDAFTYLGKLAPEDLAPLYAQSDVGLCSYGPMSNVEMPDKAYDYMAAGLPLLNSLTGELSVHVERRNMGLNYVAGDADDLVRRLRCLAQDDALRRELATNSRDAASFFDRDRQYGLLVELVEKVASADRAAKRGSRSS